MNKRLQQFIAAENLSQSQFADAIGVARASVSHILAGRNKPGFDFIVSMSSHYPTLNLEWLINGKGRMYKSDNNSPAVQSTTETVADNSQVFEDPREDEIPTEGLFDTDAFVSPEPEQVQEPAPRTSLPFRNEAPRTQFIESVPPASIPQSQLRASTPAPSSAVPADAPSPSPRSIEKIIVFYNDNTFQELK